MQRTIYPTRHEVRMTALSAHERLHEHAPEWNVLVESTKTTETSVVAFGARDDQRVVLKVARHEGEEWRSGEFLAAFDGHGLVRALDYTDGAVLLEERPAPIRAARTRDCSSKAVVPLAAIYPLGRAADAHRRLHDHVIGRIVLRIARPQRGPR